VPVSQGGLLLGLNNVAGAVGALVAPAQAGRVRGQRPLAWPPSARWRWGGWTAPVLLAGCLVPMTWASWGAARDELLRTGERLRAASPV
jgi:hypothetical protein